MNHTIEFLLEDWGRVLAEVIDEEPNFGSVLVARDQNEGGLLSDQARVRRSKVLWALQYDVEARQPELLRKLFLAEVEWHEIAPFQGLAEQLSLASFLLSQEPPADVFALLWRAKTSNFDTYAGFDSRFLGVGSVAGAVQSAKSLDDDGNAIRFLMSGEQVFFDDDDVAQFIGNELADWFPSNPKLEPPFTWFARALQSGRDGLASELLDGWRLSDDPPDPATASRLLADVGRFSEAAVVLHRSLRPENILELIRLVGLQRQAGEHPEALLSLRAVQRRINRKNDSNGYKRRCVVEEGFLLAEAAVGDRAALQAFKLANRLANTANPPPHVLNRDTAGVEWLPLVVLEQGQRAAQALGKSEAAAAYAARAATERDRIRL